MMKKTPKRSTGIKSVLALMLACVTLLMAVPAGALTILTPANDGRPNFSEDVIEIMQEVVGDQYDAEDVLSALYEIGAVDETGMPIMTDSFVVDGKTVNADELRDMAYDHLADAEDASVVVDGTTLTWSQLRSLFAIRDMNEVLQEAQEKGIAMNDDEHLELSNSLMRWLAGGSGSGQEWRRVVRAGHYNAFKIDSYNWPSYWYVSSGTVGVDSAKEYDIGKGASGEGLYYYSQEIDSYGNVTRRGSSQASLSALMTSHYSLDYPDRLWFPSIPSNGKFFYEDPAYGVRETTLERTQYSSTGSNSRLAYDGRYEYLAEFAFALNLRDILSAGGYDAKQVRITLHAASADDLLNNGGTADLFYMDSYGDVEEEISSVALTEENCAALLGGGLVLGVVNMAEYDEQVKQNDALGFHLRASDKAKKSTSVVADEQGRIRPAGMYFTFEVLGDAIAPSANRFNTRLWLKPVAGKENVYTLNEAYHGKLNKAFGYWLTSASEITLKTDIIRSAANGDLYIDLVDSPFYILSSVLRNDSETEKNPSRLSYCAFTGGTTIDTGLYGRLFLDRVSTEEGTRYKVNVQYVESLFRNDLWKYGFDPDTIIDVSDSEIINTLTYSFIDYNHHIQSYDLSFNLMMDVGKLTVGGSSATQEYEFRAYNKNSHYPVPIVMWDSVSQRLTVSESYGEADGNAGSKQISYTRGNDRAVLVQSRFLNYLNPLGYEALTKASVSYNHLTETPWVISQYGIYNVDGGTAYPHYDLTYTGNAVSDENVHIVAPAMTYYPGDVIPVIVRNPKGVFDTVPGSDAAARTAWVKENYTLTINGKTLSPAEVSIRKDTNGGYGIDMLVFLFKVGSVEGGRLDFGIGKVTISNDGSTQYNLVTDMGEDEQGNDYLATIMTPDLGDILDLNSYTVVAEDGGFYLDIPFRDDFSDEEMGVIIETVTSWTTVPTAEEPRRILKNAFAIPTSTGHPRGGFNLYGTIYEDERIPICVLQTGETYEGVRIALPEEGQDGSMHSFVRIYSGSPIPAAATLYAGYNVGLTEGSEWTSNGITTGVTPYRRLSTLVVQLPQIVYYKGKSDISLVYNSEWSSWNVTTDEATGEQTGGLKYTQYKKRGLNGTNDIVLSYKLPLTNDYGESYTFAAPENFVWTSNNPDVATVTNKSEDGVMLGVVIPTGIPGTVTFTLTCENGGGNHVIELESLSLTVVEDNTTAYLRIPDTLSPVLVRKNAAANIAFASNLQQFNELYGERTETEFTVKLYDAELEDGTLVKSSDTPVYTGTKTATAAEPITSVTIPENKLVKVSPAGSVSYIAEISADFFADKHELLPKDKTDGHFSAEVPVKVKNYPVRVSLSADGNGYLLGGDTYKAEWTLENNNDAYDWKYYIADENGNILSEYEGSGAGSTFDKKSLTFTAPKVTDVLKRTYVLTVAASNDVSEEGWSIAVKTIYVYNKDALDILVESVQNKVTVDGDKVTMDSRAWLEPYLSADRKTVKLGSGGISFGELQTDAHIDTLISLNYGAYEWGLISDAIEWKVTPQENSADAIDLYYEKMGVFSDTETSGLTSYLPTRDFRLIAIRDGKVTVEATHAMSGISSSVDVSVDVLDNELVLFQFYPATTTKVTYTLRGKDVTVSSDNQGQLALYEEAKLDDDTRFYLSSAYNGSEYVGMTTMSELKSGERNALNGRTYPVNLIKLQRPAELHLYFNDEKGAPMSSTAFTVRGGVFYDGEYAAYADLFDESNRSKGNIAGELSSGLDDLTYTTDDSNGMFRVFFNTSQFTASGELDPGKDLLYVFEIRLDGYQPEIVTVNPYESSNVVTTLTPITAEEKEKPYIWDFNVGSYSGLDFQNYLMLDDSTTKIGPNYKQSAVTLEINTALWGLDLLTVGSSETGVSKMIANPGSQYYVDEGTTVIAGDGASLVGQKYEFWMYPFSSFIFCNTVFRADAYDASLTWLDEKTEHPLDLCLFVKDNKEVVTFPFDYVLYKNMDSKEVVESEELQRKMEEQKKMIQESTKDFGLGTLVPGGDILATGLTFLTSSATGGYGVHFKVTPTADPAIYYILVSISDEEPEDDEDEDKKYELKPEYEDIQALGKEAISGIMGTHQKNYASKMEGLAGTLKKESERIYKVGEDNFDDGYDDDKEEEDEVPFSVGGSVLTRAVYDLEKDDWSLEVCGGSAYIKWNIAEWDYHKNILVVYVPVTVSVGIKIDLKGEFQTVSIREEDGDPVDYYKVGVTLKAELEGFAGVGLDVSVIALKIGFYGKFEPTATAVSLIESRGWDDDPYFGANINLKGELGIKFVFKALVVNFEYEICSFLKFDEGKDFSFGAYSTIEDKWKGAMKNGGNYKASVMPNGEISYTIEKATAVPLMLSPATTPGETIFHTYPEGELENIVFSEDGKKIFYLDDGVAFEAGVDGIAGQALAPDEENDYGQFYLDAAGTGSNCAAVWVTQTAKSAFEDLGAPTATELAAVMNSSEITAAICTNGTWTTRRLTSNTAPDLAPIVAVSRDGYNVLFAWRSLYNSDVNQPLAFDVDDSIMYCVYNKRAGTWSDVAVAYNGIANGSIYALDGEIFNNGNVLLGYTVSADIGTVDEEANESGLETFYTFLKKTDDGMENTTVRVTDNRTIDANAQTHKVYENTTEYAVLGWYSGEEDGDICLRLFDSNGAIDSKYPSSVAEMSDVRIGNDFRLAGYSKGDLVIGWTNLKEKADGENVASSELCAVKIYYRADDDDGSYHASPAQVLSSSAKACTVDDFALYAVGAEVTAVLAESDYSAGESEVSAVLTVDDYVRPGLYPTEADYNAAREEFMAAYPKGLEVRTPVSYFKAEKVSADFRNELEVTNVYWNQDTVAPGLTVPVQFTVKNNGYSAINGLTIKSKILRSATTCGTLDAPNVTLQPGESKTLTVNCKMNSSAADADYTITVKDNSSFAPQKGELLFNTPELVILDARQTDAGQGKRSLSVRIGNDNMIPARSAMRGYYVSVYQDPNFETLLAKTEIFGDLLDENAQTVTIEDLDMAEILSNAGMDGKEIPGTGVPLYVRVDTHALDEDYEAAELLDSAYDVVFVTTLCKDPENPLVIDCPDYETSGSSITGSYTITNTSIYDQDISKYAVVVRNADGLITAMQLLSDKLVDAEDVLTGAYAFTFSDPSAVDSVTVEAISEAALPTLPDETHHFGGWYTSDAYETAVAADAATGYAKWTVGNEITVSDAIEHGTVTTDLETAAEGATVTLTAVADSGYALDAFTVTDGQGNAVTVSADNTFVMPASAVTVSAKFKREAYNTASLSLADAIGLNLTLDTAFYGVDPDTAFVNLTYDHATGPKSDIQTDKLLLSEATPKSDGRYTFSVYLAPAQITEEITIELYADGTAAEPVLTQEYSIAEYCKTVESAMPELAAVCKALRVYGAASQKMFKVNTANLAEDDYARIVAGYNADSIGSYSVTNGATGLAVKSMSLDVQNKITVRHTLTLAEGALPENYSVSLTTSTSRTNAQASLEYDDASGKFYAVVKGIEGPNLNMTYTLTITNENDGTSTEIKNFCALNYAKYVLSADLGNSDLENVVRGMCMYNLLADAYFEK